LPIKLILSVGFYFSRLLYCIASVFKSLAVLVHMYFTVYTKEMVFRIAFSTPAFSVASQYLYYAGL